MCRRPVRPAPIQESRPAALSFSGPSGSTTPQQQQVTLLNPTSVTIHYSTTVFTSSGTGWLSASPASGPVPPGNASISVAADLLALPPGVQTGTLSIGFDNGYRRCNTGHGDRYQRGVRIRYDIRTGLGQQFGWHAPVDDIFRLFWRRAWISGAHIPEGQPSSQSVPAGCRSAAGPAADTGRLRKSAGGAEWRRSTSFV